ncbi:unnamed protein product, partial [Prorocentrum cordatum]
EPLEPPAESDGASSDDPGPVLPGAPCLRLAHARWERRRGLPRARVRLRVALARPEAEAQVVEEAVARPEVEAQVVEEAAEAAAAELATPGEATLQPEELQRAVQTEGEGQGPPEASEVVQLRVITGTAEAGLKNLGWAFPYLPEKGPVGQVMVRVTPGGWAAGLGVQEGDRLALINHESPDGMLRKELMAAIKARPLELTFHRQEQVRDGEAGVGLAVAADDAAEAPAVSAQHASQAAAADVGPEAAATQPGAATAAAAAAATPAAADLASAASPAAAEGGLSATPPASLAGQGAAQDAVRAAAELGAVSSGAADAAAADAAPGSAQGGHAAARQRPPPLEQPPSARTELGAGHAASEAAPAADEEAAGGPPRTFHEDDLLSAAPPDSQEGAAAPNAAALAEAGAAEDRAAAAAEQARAALAEAISSATLRPTVDDLHVMLGVQPLKASPDVQVQDVTVREVDGELVCDMQLRGDASVRAAAAAVAAAVRDPADMLGVRCALLRAGADRDAEPYVGVEWPLELARREVSSIYGQCDLSIDTLQQLVPVLDSCYEMYSARWNAAQSEEPQECAQLLAVPSMCRFEGQLLPISEGQRGALYRDAAAQEASDLDSLLLDAAAAQWQLKTSLAPDTAWAQEQLDDTSAVPPGDTRRLWRSGQSHLAPCGEHLDPGIRSRAEVAEMASRQPLESLPGVSRLLIFFDTVECLLAALRGFLQGLEVVQVDNMFRDPSCLGLRYVGIGVRQHVEAEQGEAQRCHISEVQLQLRCMRDAEAGAGQVYAQRVGHLLGAAGVEPQERAAVSELLLRVLDWTDGAVARESLRELAGLVACEEDGPPGAPGAEADAAGLQERRRAAEAAAQGAEAARAELEAALQRATAELEAVHQQGRERRARGDAALRQCAGLSTQAKNEVGEEHQAVVVDGGGGLPDEAQCAEHVRRLGELWRAKEGSILQELCQNLRKPHAESGELAAKLTAGDLAQVCHGLRERFGEKATLHPELKDHSIAIACWVLYTMTDVDIDRLLGFDCPELPEDKQLPKDRDEFYRPYRAKYGSQRNPHMFGKANWAARVSKTPSVNNLRPLSVWSNV